MKKICSGGSRISNKRDANPKRRAKGTEKGNGSRRPGTHLNLGMGFLVVFFPQNLSPVLEDPGFSVCGGRGCNIRFCQI